MDPSVELAAPQHPASRLRSRHNAHQTLEARTKFWRIVIVITLFAVLVSGGLLTGAAGVFAMIQSHFKTEDLTAKYKTARISRPMLDGVFCHRLVLDNKTGKSIEDKIERCDAESVAPRRGQTQFVWGK